MPAQRGGDINEIDSQGNNVLMMAILCNSPELVKELLREYSPDKTRLNREGKNALQLAQQMNNPEIIRLLKPFFEGL